MQSILIYLDFFRRVPKCARWSLEMFEDFPANALTIYKQNRLQKKVGHFLINMFKKLDHTKLLKRENYFHRVQIILETGIAYRKRLDDYNERYPPYQRRLNESSHNYAPNKVR